MPVGTKSGVKKRIGHPVGSPDRQGAANEESEFHSFSRFQFRDMIHTVNYPVGIASISISLGINFCAVLVAGYLWRFGHGRIDGPGGSLPPGELPPPFEPAMLFSI